MLLRQHLEFILWLKEEVIADEFVSSVIYIVRTSAVQEVFLAAVSGCALNLNQEFLPQL